MVAMIATSRSAWVCVIRLARYGLVAVLSRNSAITPAVARSVYAPVKAASTTTIGGVSLAGESR